VGVNRRHGRGDERRNPTKGDTMNANTRWRTIAALLTLVASSLVFGTLTSEADARGVTRQQLEAHGWTCFVPPTVPDTVVCFDPGRGRPFPGNPDPRPSYSLLAFSASSGEFLFTVHVIRADLYSGQPCGDEPYIFRALIGYWECLHR
jgi:hypothetical protein